MDYAEGLPISRIFQGLVKRVAVNSFWLLITRIATQALAIVFTILLARSLGEVGLGQYAFIASIVFIGNILTTFGLDTLLIREIARTRNTDTTSLGAALWIQIVLSAIFILGIALAAGIWPNKNPETILSLKVYSLSLIPLAFYTIYSAALRAYERMDLFLLSNLVAVFIQTTGAFFIFRAKGNLLDIALLLLFSQLITAGIAAWLCTRWLPNFTFHWIMPRTTILIIARQGWPLALMSGLGVIYQRLGILSLSLLSPDAATGWFTAAVRIPEAFKVIHYAFFGAIFPVMSRTAFNNRQPEGAYRGEGYWSTKLYRLSFTLLLSFAFLAALIITLAAKPLIYFLYGANYSPSIGVLQILAWSLIPYTISSKISLDLVTTGQEHWVSRTLAITVVITAVLYALLIPALGILGASLSALVGETIQALIFILLTIAPHRSPNMVKAE